LTTAKEKFLANNKQKVKWGFIWAMFLAVFWGFGYVPMQIAWALPPFDTAFPYLDGETGMYVASIMMSATMALIFTLVLFVLWTLATGKAKDYPRVIRKFKASKWLLVGCLCGGPLAIFGSLLSAGYIGAYFAAAIGLLSAVFGCFFARMMNHERLSKKTIAGLVLIVIGGIAIVNPVQVMNELAAGGTIMGYVGGIASAIGWGLEGNFAVKALDVMDSDTAITVRYSFETLVWFVIMMPITICFIGIDNFAHVFIDTFSSGNFIFWMFIDAMTLGLCYVMQYKAFPLLGVGRTLAIGALYVPVSVVALFVFCGVQPEITFLVGVIIAVVGTFVMYWERSSIEGGLRDVGGGE